MEGEAHIFPFLQEFIHDLTVGGGSIVKKDDGTRVDAA